MPSTEAVFICDLALMFAAGIGFGLVAACIILSFADKRK